MSGAIICFWLVLSIHFSASFTSTSVSQDFVTSCSTSASISSCSSPWQYCADGVCTCGEVPPYFDLKCSREENLTQTVQMKCVTENRLNNHSGYSTYIGDCLYNRAGQLPNDPNNLNEFLCGGYNRTGILCGACKEDHHPLVHSFDMNCVVCSSKALNLFKFAMAVFLPLTVFYFIIVLFSINIASSLHGYVVCCQGIAIPAIARVLLIQAPASSRLFVRGIGPLLSTWNLDILRFFPLNICLGTNTLQTLTLELVVGIYPLLLIMWSYLLIRLYDNNFRPVVLIWKPFKAFLSLFHKTWEVRTSLIDAFISFFLLSNMKFLDVQYDLLTPVAVYQLNSTGHLTYSWRLYYDATVPYFGKRHLPYAVLALAVHALFMVIPMLLLILYPFRWFQKLLNLFPFRMHVLHTFMDIFQGCYKDGTAPGSRDYRWFASFFFLIRFFLIIVGAATLTVSYFFLASMFLVLAAILCIVLEPFKPSLADYSSVNTIFLLLLALWYVSVAGHQWAKLKHQKTAFFLIFGFLTAFVILLYISFLILKWMCRQRKFGVAVIRKLYTTRQGYQQLET